MSTVFVHIGQCGNQVSQCLWKCFEKDGGALERYWCLLRLIYVTGRLQSIDRSSYYSACCSSELIIDILPMISWFQDTTDTLPCHIHLPVCLWIMDPHSRAPKKNTSHGNEVLPQDTAHLIQRPCYQRGSPCQDPEGSWTTRRSPNDRKKTQTAVVMFPVHQVWPKPSCKAQWKGEEDKADKGRGGKTTLGNGQAWSSASPRGKWRTGKNGENWLQNYLWCPNDPRG